MAVRQKCKKWIVLLWMSVFFLTGCAGKGEEVWMISETESQNFEASEKSTEKEKGNNTENETIETTQGDTENGRNADTGQSCVVHICGAVARPGVYAFPKGSRICDAIEKAGGFLPEADTEIRNQAELLADGEQIRILTKEEAEEEREAAKEQKIAAGQEADSRVNINTAQKEELCTLPGIGENRAESILAYRQEKGSFSCIEDIMKVSGIKEAAFSKIKDKIRVN